MLSVTLQKVFNDTTVRQYKILLGLLYRVYKEVNFLDDVLILKSLRFVNLDDPMRLVDRAMQTARLMQ